MEELKVGDIGSFLYRGILKVRIAKIDDHNIYFSYRDEETNRPINTNRDSVFEFPRDMAKMYFKKDY